MDIREQWIERGASVRLSAVLANNGIADLNGLMAAFEDCSIYGFINCGNSLRGEAASLLIQNGLTYKHGADGLEQAALLEQRLKDTSSRIADLQTELRRAREEKKVLQGALSAAWRRSRGRA